MTDVAAEQITLLNAEAAGDFPTSVEAQYPLARSIVSASDYTDPDLFEREMRAIFHEP